jgi:TPR repeat protein
MYDMGKGVAENNVEAVRWYRSAAEQGDNVAQYNLGTMYEWGEGVEEDLNEAISWYRKSAKQGYENAKKRLEELATANSSTNQKNAALDEKASEEFSDPAFDEGIAYLLNTAQAAGSDSFYANQYSADGDYVRQDIIATLRNMAAEGPTGGNSFAVYSALADGEMYPSCRTRGRLNHSCVDTQRTFSFAPNPSLAGQIKRKKGCYSAKNPGC